jgi:hypothetical protein
MTVLDRPPFSTQPPRRLTDAELAQRHQQAFPEALGPGTDHESGAVSYAQERDPRIGEIPHLLDPETVAAENAEREARLAALTPEQRAAMDTVAGLVAAELRRR